MTPRKLTDLLMRHLPLWIALSALAIVCWGPITNVVASTIGKPGGAAGNYQTIEDDGVAVTQRPTFNIIGGTVADDAGNSRTNITLAGGGNVTTSATLTAGLPVIGNAGVDVDIGTRSGNTTEYATADGTLANGNCVEVDANGNLTDSGAACGGGAASIFYPSTAPPTVGWTWDDQDTCTVSSVSSPVRLMLEAPAGGSGTCGYHRAIGASSNYTVTFGMIPTLDFNTGDITRVFAGVREAASGKAIIYVVGLTGSNIPEISVNRYDAGFSIDSVPTIVTSGRVAGAVNQGGPLFVRVVDDGTDITWLTSNDGIYFMELHSETRGNFFTTSADQAMFGVVERRNNATLFHYEVTTP